MLTLEQYILHYNANMEYYRTHKSVMFDNILEAIGSSNFFTTASRFESDKWLLEVFHRDDYIPSTTVPVLTTNPIFTDYHISEEDARCLIIHSNPFHDNVIGIRQFDGMLGHKTPELTTDISM